MKNKELTKRKLVKAVGEIIRTEGFSNLKISKIAKHAEVDRKLVYRYFGGIDRLIEAYIVENDYWMIFADQAKPMLEKVQLSNIQQVVTDILQNQFKFFSKDKEMQRVILLELTVKSPLLRSIHNARETLGQQFLELTDEHFEGSNVNFRAVTALLVGGIYYTILHTMYNGTTFSDMDINSESGKEELLETIKQIVSWAFNAGNKRNY